MKINPFVYGLIVLSTFMGIVMVAQQAGWWSTSGKIDGSGQALQPSAADVNSIKGWMTLEQVSVGFHVPVADILSAFNLPAETPASTPLKDLESDTFDIPSLRSWLGEQRATP